MSTDDTKPTPSSGSVERLPSLAALQTAHKELLQAHRQEDATPEMLDRIEAFIYQGQATGAVLDVDEDRWTAQGVLDYWSATLFRAGRKAPDATLADFDPNLAPELPDELCPYVGLDPFREATQAAFFGRERLVATLVEKLADSRLLVVVGPSGSGKSSVVLAGLIPALQRGALPGSETWRFVPRMVPGSNPLANLVRLIQSVGGGEEEDPVEWARQQEMLLRENPHHLLDLVNATGEAPLVGVVDQFEEVFTLCSDQQVRQAFIDNLVNLVQAPGARHTVIFTMRTDFEPFVARLPDFYPLFEQALVRVTPLSGSELREAIEKPAEKIGLKFESGIVDRLLQDLLGEPAGLPLLQFTLLRLWESRSRNRITWEAYNRLGSGRLALARSADAFYDELIFEDQLAAKRIFLRLVRPGEGLEFTSNRVRLRTLYQAGEAKERVDQVLARLIEAHLVRVSEGDVAADTQVEVAHEALVRNWPQLVGWLEEERQNIRRRQIVSDSAERWFASGRNPGALFTTETLVQDALSVTKASGVPLNEQEAEFIRASQEAQEAVRFEKEAARKRELDFERQRANEQAAAAKRLRRLTVFLVVVAFLVLIASMIALGQRSSAVAAARAEREQRLIALGQRSSAIEAQSTAVAAATAEREQRLIAETARMEAETEAAKVSANMKTAQDALRGKEGLIDGLETAEAQKLVLSIENQALKASLAALASSPTSVVQFITSTPIPTRTPTVSALITSTVTPVRTTVGTQTTTPRSTATPTRTATPSQTRPPSSMDFQSATATAAALATLRSEVQAAQTAVSCDILLQYLIRAINRCSELKRDWVCYAARGVEVEPSNVRFEQPGDRAPLKEFRSIQTMPHGGVVVAMLQDLSEQPFWLIAAQDSLYVLTNRNNDRMTCEPAPPGLVVYTETGQRGLLNINGVLIDLY